MASLSADSTAGEEPFTATFRVVASDADGDTLTWSLDVDNDTIPEASGEGVEVDETFSWTYAVAGEYTAVLRVTDGTTEVAEALLILVEPSEPAA
jgi:PKD repeat protein